MVRHQYLFLKKCLNYKDIYKYYGVTQEDIETKSERYQDVVRALCR